MSKKAVMLLSGGLDSATIGAIAKEQGYELYALSCKYGQRHAVELNAAVRVAQHLGVADHKTAEIDLRLFGGSALTDELDVPKANTVEEIGEGIPITYVPARNTIFLSFALAWAETLDAYDIFIGVNALDYSGYPDCRPAFIEAYEAMANQATAYATEKNEKVRIHAPLIDMTKAQIITQGTQLGVDYGLTLSCYDPSEQGEACGHCDSCLLRKKGFEEAGVADPTIYRKNAA
ncbi:MAG: 7-cyano-7-deazaguanine synthase QueC [Rickettsiales bacterium]|nr:7-cyano-7-deazaguanine synthase QueC [Rickettsiales bacterium]